MPNYKLLIDTADQKGLVKTISTVLFDLDVNIDKNTEYVDNENGKFFMRTVFSGDCDISTLRTELQDKLPNANIRIFDNRKKNIILFATKESHALGDILVKHDSNELNANIIAVVGNHTHLQKLVERFEIPFVHVSAEGLSREAHEAKVFETLDKYEFDYIVLAKYMRILTPAFVGRYAHRIINIHHSFLPAFIGANPYKQAHERGVKIIGATSHFVTNDLDEGPIIHQETIRVSHEDTWQDMQKAGRDVEKIVLSKALELVLEDRVFIYGNKTVIL